MSILVPFNNEQTLEAFRNAGASEFYIGFVDDAWTQRFGQTADLNRLSGFRAQANAYTFEQLLEVIERAAAAGVRLYVPFNAGMYTDAQLEFIASRYFEPLAAAGCEGAILSGTDLIAPAKQAGLKAVASTMCGIFNVDIAAVYVAAGIDRIIFPRESTLEDISQVSAAFPELAFEVFLMRNGCVFSDTYCLGRHCDGHYSLCRDLVHGERWNEQLYPVDAHTQQLAQRTSDEWGALFGQACGQCALWRLEQLGASAYKIVGRCDNPDEIAADIALTARNLKIAHSCATETEYHARMERPTGYNGTNACAGRMNCYYPEVFD